MNSSSRQKTIIDNLPHRHIASVVILLIFATVLSVVLFVSNFSPMKDDIAWLLYVARQWLAGRTLYQDLVEVNPPLIIWLSAIPSLLARWVDVSPKFVAMPMFVAQSLLSAWWGASILRRCGGPFSDRISVFAAIGTILILLPGADLGQREHLLVSGFIPYLALSAMSLDGYRISRVESISAGIMAALFCALKPLYGACFVTLECVMMLNGRRPWRAMPIAAGLTLAGYAALIIVFCPAYLHQAVPMALALYGVSNVSFSNLLSESAVLLAGEALAVLLLALRWRSLKHRNLMIILVVFAATSIVVCFADQKDWYYHRIPAIISTALALMVFAVDEILARKWSLRPTLLAAVAVVLTFCGTAIRQLEPDVKDAIEPRHSVVERIEGIVRAEHARSYIAFSEWIALGFPVVNNTGVVWASRFDSMWALKGEIWRESVDRAVARDWPIARWVSHDFIAGCPDIAVVDTREPTDYINVLKMADPAFARVWSRYKRIDAFDGLVVYKRALGGCLDVWVAAGANTATLTR